MAKAAEQLSCPATKTLASSTRGDEITKRPVFLSFLEDNVAKGDPSPHFFSS